MGSYSWFVHPRGRKWSLETGSDPGFGLVQGVCKPLWECDKGLVLFLADSLLKYLQVCRAGWVSVPVASAAIRGDLSGMWNIGISLGVHFAGERR